MAHKKHNQISAGKLNLAAGAFLLGAVLFFVLTLCSQRYTNTTVLPLVIFTLAVMLVRGRQLCARITLPLVALGALMLMSFVSVFYAASPMNAVQEFLRMSAAFCAVLCLTAVAPAREDHPGRWIATVLECVAAAACLVSIDLISTRLISGVALGVVSLFTDFFEGLAAVEPGVRMTSIYTNPNMFAGCAGIGVLLSLGLMSATHGTRERMAHAVCLFVCSFGFVLAFSMGASAAIALAFVAYLLLEQKARRGDMLTVMVETLVLAVACAALVSKTSFESWNGFDIVPLGCTVIGAALLCVFEKFINPRVAEKLEKNGKAVAIIVIVLIVAVAVFAAAAVMLTGVASLDAGQTLRRAAYPDGGNYTLSADYSGQVHVTVESQNKQETMMHTGTVLYSGDLAAAEFTVPEDSLVVYFNFHAPDGAEIRSAAVGGKKIPLGYKLLPGFIANRLQGILANENAIQRTVFFDDGMKIFADSPMIGSGLGAFQDGVKRVQSFYYVSNYVHNHYIQTLLELGVVGLVLFVGVVGVCAAAIFLCRRKENANPMLPALGALLVFMAVHAFTEVVFSLCPYIPLAYGVFGVTGLCCADAFAWPRTDKRIGGKERLGVAVVVIALLGVFAVLLGGHVRAERMMDREPTIENLKRAADTDVLGWERWAGSYVYNSADFADNADVQENAYAYAQKLEQNDAFESFECLAELYFRRGEAMHAVDMLKKYVSNAPADNFVWDNAFVLLEIYEQDSAEYTQGVLEIAAMMETWNAENIGKVALSDQASALIERMQNKIAG
ncbi:MAG: hypothetical protein E7472_04580 [Ruminococcaceae bacterium]|nr:hypothetical protein [Oscillospiraceae bacterium]